MEEASTKATDVAFGLTTDSTVTGKQRGKMAAHLRAEQVRHHESAYSEGKSRYLCPLLQNLTGNTNLTTNV